MDHDMAVPTFATRPALASASTRPASASASTMLELTPPPDGLFACVDRRALPRAGIPGLSLLTDKRNLAEASRLLGWEKRLVPESTADESVARGEPYAWLAKRGAHRGVSLYDSSSRSPQQQSEALLLQRRIDPPLLIDGRAWDMGVYVAFEQRPDGSIGSTLFDDLLLPVAALSCSACKQLKPSMVKQAATDTETAWCGRICLHTNVTHSFCTHTMMQSTVHGVCAH